MTDETTGILDKRSNIFYVLEMGPVSATYSHIDRLRSILIRRSILKYANASQEDQRKEPDVAVYGLIKDRPNLKIETIYISENVKRQALKKAETASADPWKT